MIARALAVAGLLLAATARDAAADIVAEPAIRVVRHAAGSAGSASIELANLGDAAVEIAGFALTCDGAVALAPADGGAPFTLAPGARRAVSYSCPASLPAGLHRCAITATGTATGPSPAAPLASFVAACDTAGAAVLTAEPPSHDFGAVAIGSRAAVRLALTNATPAALARLALQLDDAGYTIAAPCNPDAAGCVARGVPAGGRVEVEVACRPDRVGPRTAQLHAGGLAAPVALACTGVANPGPALAISPRTVDAGSGGSAVVTAAHTGEGGALHVARIQLVDGGVSGAAGDWTATLSGACDATPCTLTAGQALRIGVAFDPRALDRRPATLVIGYALGDGPPRTATVPLTGFGAGAAIAVVSPPPVLDFGVTGRDAPSELRLRIANTGNRDLAAAAIEPPGPPFIVAASLPVPLGEPVALPVTCRSATPGAYTAVLAITAPAVPGMTAAQRLEIPLACEVRDTPFRAAPGAVDLGEVRIGEPAPAPVAIAVLGNNVALAGAALLAASNALVVTAPQPPTTPSTISLSVAPVAPLAPGDLANAIEVTASDRAIAPIEIPVRGTAVIASYVAPDEVALGTFCVGQPTRASPLALVADGSATIELPAPVLAQGGDSPFELILLSPLHYPTRLAPGTPGSAAALVAIRPLRRATAASVSDELVWSPDVLAAPVHRTRLRAELLDDGAAIAPAAIAFGRAPIHVDIANAQPVTLQNCSAAPLDLVAPTVPAPFSLDSPARADFPVALAPGEAMTFTIGFHPTTLGTFARELVVASDQLPAPLTVVLTGEGVTGSGSDGDGGGRPGRETTSFYACGGCTAGDTGGSLAAVALVLCVGRWRRRRRRAA